MEKGNTEKILNRKDYVCKMESILNGSSKFHKKYIDHDKILNHLIHIKNRVTNVLKNPGVKKKSPLSNLRI